MHRGLGAAVVLPGGGQGILFCGFSQADNAADLYCRPPGFTWMPQGKYLAGGLSLQVNTNFNIMHYTFRLYSQQIHRSNFVLWLSAVPYSFYFPSGLSYDNTDCPFFTAENEVGCTTGNFVSLTYFTGDTEF